MTGTAFGYYYLHQNGDLIFKPSMPHLLEDFRESDLVVRWWPFYKDNQKQAELILKQAWESGASLERLAELAEKWHIRHCHMCCSVGDACPCDSRPHGEDEFCDCKHPDRKEG